MNLSSLNSVLQPLTASSAYFTTTPSPIQDSNRSHQLIGLSSSSASAPSQSPTFDPRQHSFHSNSSDTDAKPVIENGHEKGKARSQASALKRKRDTVPPQAQVSIDDIHDPDHPKRKKANRACYACQKAHLTCDDARPCQRCIKKGCADQCVEGHRKKAKYLLEDEELEALKKNKNEKGGSQGNNTSGDNDNPFSTNFMSDSLFNVPLDPSLTFASDAASLEYNVLSQILGNVISPTDPPFRPDGQQQGQLSMPGYGDQANYQITWPNLVVQPQQQQQSQQRGMQQQPDGNALFQDGYGIQAQQPLFPQDTNGYMPNPMSAPPNGSLRLGVPPSPPASNGSPASANIGTASAVSQPPNNGFAPTQLPLSQDAAGGVYRLVTKGYDYTQGYHFLMKFLTERYGFEKNDILRVVRALAIFRPSLIALQMPLSEEDETFVEKSFQRTLVELDKLISYSGTPTVVWRRTGEICLVGVEFTVLTEWNKEELLNGGKFIYELFENQSVVEYWEKFASHAFENSSQSVYTHCVLLKADGSPLPCAFCFSIRRDIFALPSVVIGQWLPLL